MKNSDKSLIVFITSAFVIGISIQFFYYYNHAPSLLLFAMWAPTIALLLSGKDSIREVWPQIKKISCLYVLIGFFMPIFFSITYQCSLYLLNLGKLNVDTFEFSADGLYVEHIQNAHLLLGSARQHLLFFTINLFSTIIFAGVINTFIGALGEEIGWRGFLFKRLQQYSEPINSAIIVGILWAYWHIPANIAGINGQEHVWITALIIFPLHALALALFFSWLTIKSGSIWPAAFAHGVNNTISNIEFIKANSSTIESVVSLFFSLLLACISILLIQKIQTDELKRKYLLVVKQS
ncbi:MAG: CPBP family intramembrane metalloprotease [Oligoflexia bacterium]|nr:CPBP family intramembrane metalloprotease [Oligoflexia bacterium]